MRKLASWKFLTINAYFFGISFLWNSMHVILLPAILLLYVPDALKNTYLGVLTGAGLVIAMAIQPLAGAISDRWASRVGRRRPMIVGGTLVDFLFLGVMALAGGIPGLAIGYIGLQFSSNTAHGPVQGLLPDLVPSDQLGRASAVKSSLDMLGIIAASLFMGRFFHADGSNWPASVALVAGVLAVTLVVTMLGSREQSSLPLSSKESMGSQLRGMFRVDWKQAPGFAPLILTRFVFLAGVYGIQAFAQYFIRDTLHQSDPLALTGNLMAVIAISLTLCALGSGWLCDRLGRKPMHVAASLMVAVGSLMLILATSPTTVLLCGCIVGAGTGIFLTANWALATHLAPVKEAGLFLGLTNLATAGAGALSRFTGPAIDAVNASWPGHFFGYDALFLSSAVFALLALLVLMRVPETRNKTIMN
jgi:MFS family permease